MRAWSRVQLPRCNWRVALWRRSICTTGYIVPTARETNSHTKVTELGGNLIARALVQACICALRTQQRAARWKHSLVGREELENAKVGMAHLVEKFHKPG